MFAEADELADFMKSITPISIAILAASPFASERVANGEDVEYERVETPVCIGMVTVKMHLISAECFRYNEASRSKRTHWKQFPQ